MIGIYKITNRKNNKIYIGQSIHCGKRLDEHCKGNQLIDEIIQLEGIENFNFEILKQVDKKKLSYWEDYYIIKYNTYFPNGYNKRWNCNENIREEIKKKIKEEDKQKEVRYFYALNYEKEIKTKLTSKQFIVYTYLLSISKWDAQTNEQHYYVYFNSFTAKEAARICGVSQPTWRAAIKKLLDLGFIQYKEEDKWYTIPLPKEYAPLNVKLLSALLQFSSAINNSGNLAGVYSTLYRYWKNQSLCCESCCVTVSSLIRLFGGTTDTTTYKYYEILLHLFNSTGLMTIQFNRKKYCGKFYTEYEILFVNNQLPSNLENSYYEPDDIKNIVEALENSLNNEQD